MIRIYGLKACDTCRKALKEARAAGHQAELIDVREVPLDPARRAAFLEAFGARLLNTRSTTWRGLSESERARAPDDLLAAYPALMKRPVTDTGAALYLGWDAGVRSAVL